jgi:diguanylate cyclase (GGDEF)-like protein
MSENERKQQTASREEFQRSLVLLDEAVSWEIRDGILKVLLLPVAIVLLSLSPLGWFGRALVGVVWIAGGLTVFRKHSRLKTLRVKLVEQMNRATKNHVRAEKLYGLSILDPLTGLYNRRFGETRLKEEIARAGEVSDPLLLLAIDFDRFKQINDTYGHAAGDLALKAFSRSLRRAVRACDVPIRVGGDEFLVILPECPPDKVPLIMSRMGTISFTVDGKQIPVCFSYGLAQHQPQDTPDEMIKRADERLYAKKAERKAAAAAQLPPAAEPAREESVAPVYAASLVPARCDAPSASIPQPEDEPAFVRRSVRVPKRIPILLIGNELTGKTIMENTKTVDLSRYGLALVSRHKLALDQEITARCLETNREADAKVVRVISSQLDSYIYGLAFVGSTVEIGGVEIPAFSESEREAERDLFPRIRRVYAEV